MLLGVSVGALVGYQVASPGHAGVAIGLIAMIAMAIFWCGLTAPRPIPNRPPPERA